MVKTNLEPFQKAIVFWIVVTQLALFLFILTLRWITLIAPKQMTDPSPSCFQESLVSYYCLNMRHQQHHHNIQHVLPMHSDSDGNLKVINYRGHSNAIPIFKPYFHNSNFTVYTSKTTVQAVHKRWTCSMAVKPSTGTTLTHNRSDLSPKHDLATRIWEFCLTTLEAIDHDLLGRKSLTLRKFKSRHLVVTWHGSVNQRLVAFVRHSASFSEKS